MKHGRNENWRKTSGVVFGLVATAGVLLPAGNATADYFEFDKLLASDGQADDWFGSSIDIDGTIAIIGAHGEDEEAVAAGAAYLYNIETDTQIAKLTADDDASAGDWFGLAVAIDGTNAIVGADHQNDRGAVYLFDATTGTELDKFTASDGQPADFFGSAVDICGMTVVIGAMGEDDVASAAGAVYVFDIDGTELYKLKDTTDGAANDRFGASVAVYNNIAVIGAPYDDHGADTDAGSAYLYDVATGSKLFKLVGSDTDAGDNFGAYVAIHGTIAVVGAPKADEDITPTAGTGAVYVFDVITGNQLAKINASDVQSSDRFGSVSISGTTILVGAHQDDDNGSNAGSAYLFDVDGTQLQKLTPNDAAATDEFGKFLAISGTTAVIGAVDDDDNGSSSGSAYVYVFDPCE